MQILRLHSPTVGYHIPSGWDRATICKDEDEEGYDPWFAFCQGLAFGVEYFDAFDAGLLTFILAGPGEKWSLVSQVRRARGGNQMRAGRRLIFKEII